MPEELTMTAPATPAQFIESAAAQIEAHMKQVERLHAEMTQRAHEYITERFSVNTDTLYQHEKRTKTGTQKIVIRLLIGCGKNGQIILEGRQYDRKGWPTKKYVQLTTVNLMALTPSTVTARH